MKNLFKVLFGTLGIALSTFASATSYNYSTSVRVNGIELNKLVSADLLPRLVSVKPQKFEKFFSSCTGKHEFNTLYRDNSSLKFEVDAEDNPEIKDQNFFKNKFNYLQLGGTKGRVSINWTDPAQMTQRIVISNLVIDSQYSLNEFRRDFPISGRNPNTTVLLLDRSEVPKFIKDNSEFEPPYTANIKFNFKAGKISSLEINQAVGC